MFPLLLLGGLALLFLGQKKPAMGGQPSGGQPSGGAPAPAGGGGPIVVTPGTTASSSSGMTACDFDQGLPPQLKDQAMALLAQVQGANALSALPLATMLDSLAATLEMSQYPKTAACLRQQANVLRGKKGSGILPTGPIQAGGYSLPPLSIEALPKPKA